jgi:hypothetical protein
MDINYLYLALGIFVIFMIYGITTVIKFSRTKKMSGEKRKHFDTLLKRISRGVSSREQIVDMDKLYHKILMALWYHGTFGEILKMEPNEVSNINTVWEIHKLRNNIVHDFDNHDEKYLRTKSIAYKREIERLLQNTK